MNNQIKEEGLTDAYLLGKYDGIKQGRADAIEEFRNKLFGKLVRLTLSMWHFKLFDDALQETYNELKEQK